MQTLLEKLLSYYKIDEGKLNEINKSCNLSTFNDGRAFDDIEKAVELVKDAINKNKKIIVYGDYDADGIMGTSILVKMFQYSNYVVNYYIPNRYTDGYGLTLKHAQEYLENGFELVITVDNGITAFEAIDYLRNHNVDVLVLDHHQMQEKLPNANVVIHPIYSHFGETASSGAFTAFMYSISFLGYPDKYLSTLASISLISDMMPLLDYNRYLLKVVFSNYEVGEFLPIDLLSDHERINENVIGMKIAPRINSIGRLTEDDSINKIVTYFTTNDRDYILNYFSYIVDINEERKTISKESIDIPEFDPNSKAIVLLGDYKEGIIGLIANNLVNKYHVPTIIFTKSGDDQLKGSGRAPEGFNIVKIFNELNQFMITFGGHALAGGCSIYEKDFDVFKKEFSSLAASIPFEKPEKQVIDINFNEINNDNYELIQSFSPFGESWPAPIFKIRHIKTSNLTYSRDEKHILTTVGYTLRIIGFNMNKSDVSQFSFIDMTGTLRKNSFRGKTFLEFVANDYQDSNN